MYPLKSLKIPKGRRTDMPWTNEKGQKDKNNNLQNNTTMIIKK
jgi:hypothetical protein